MLAEVESVLQVRGEMLVAVTAVALLVVVIREMREDQPLHERTGHAGRVTEIHRRTDDEHIRFMGFLQDRTQVIFDSTHTVRFGVLQLAGKTTLPKIIQKLFFFLIFLGAFWTENKNFP